MVPQETRKSATLLQFSRDHATHDFFRRKYTNVRLSASEQPLQARELGVRPPIVSKLNASFKPDLKGRVLK